MKRKIFLLPILFLFFYYYSLAFCLEFSSFGGGEIDTQGQGFSFLGVDISQKIEKGLCIKARLVPNYLTYKYKSETRMIRANSPGVYGLGGLKLEGKNSSISMFCGIEYRNTNLNPDKKDAKVRGDTIALLLQGELYYQIFRFTELGFFGSYSSTDNFFYEKIKIKRQITNLDFKKPNSLHLGLEQFYGRNPDFKMIGLGPVLEIYNIPKKFSLILRGGYKHDKTFGTEAYGGFEFFKAF